MANKDSYVLPKATQNTLGGVKVGKGLSIDDEGVLKCPAVLDKIVENEYVLPKATMFILGGVKVGKGLSIDDEGRLDSNMVLAASGTQIGGVIIGDGITVDADGRISVDIPKNLSGFINDVDFKTGSDVRELISEHNSATSAHELTIKLAIQKYMEENGNSGGSNSNNSSSLPVGSVTAYAGRFTPAGWLLCDGSSVSRTDYPELFSAIGTTYGSGDGRSTFNLPILTDNRFIEGYVTSGKGKNAGLPNIKSVNDNNIAIQTWANVTGDGPLKTPYVSGASRQRWQTTSDSSCDLRALGFDASIANNIYGSSDTVQPKSLTMRYIIKC